MDPMRLVKQFYSCIWQLKSLSLMGVALELLCVVHRPLVKRGITEFRRGITDVLFNSREEFYCGNNKLHKYKVL